MEIEISKTYNCFDDGKIRESRMYKVEVFDVIPFDKIDEDVLCQWEIEKTRCSWLYAEKTDFFIKTWNGEELEYFTRTKDGGWFSLGYMNCGRLDVDGSLTASIDLND